ncbi:dynamin family protein [Alicyclobacillus sp. ALC3]|uniref:dynamin family protein n=1 Tax=Alicyclobacillus sp. ALC3 TaxID=2796143 RepID=UPI0023781D40|nr:dynamin family protein [Alicyclobacillus sp. ALC3]WDL98210.1 dynamin family protein [Alicyclobacillus sp. ALC3]
MISAEQLTTLSYLRSVQSALLEAGDEEIANRVGDLCARFETPSPQVIVAFCGLFSAGKSSLLNALLGGGALETGAVPTTSEVAQVAMRDTEGRVLLYDTPGIDSTDEAHQRATEAVLHRADVVVLVADYQHVEAEANLELAHTLTSEGKRVWFVINQVDKHLDFELPFEEFQSGVDRALETWEIDAEQVFYTSTRSSVYNQFAMLERAVRDLGAHSDAWVRERVLRSLHDLVEQHVDSVLAEQRLGIDLQVREAFGVIPYDTAEAEQWWADLAREKQALETSLQSERHAILAHQEEQRQNLVREVDLAQIAPYGTTELGRAYIESSRPGFRSGWFSTQQKIESERARRLEKFVNDLADRTRTFLVWPLQGHLRGMVHAADWADEKWLGSVDRVDVEVSLAECQNQVKTGALVSQEYSYQYVKDVVAGLKRRFSARLGDWLDEWFAAELEQLDKAQVQRAVDLAEVEQKHSAVGAWLEVQTERARQVATLCQTDEENLLAKQGATDERAHDYNRQNLS